MVAALLHSILEQLAAEGFHGQLEVLLWEKVEEKMNVGLGMAVVGMVVVLAWWW